MRTWCKLGFHSWTDWSRPYKTVPDLTGFLRGKAMFRMAQSHQCRFCLLVKERDAGTMPFSQQDSMLSRIFE